jgi:hypothetical protein
MSKVKEELKGQLSQEEIELLKQKHGDIFALKVSGSICYLKKPSRKTLGYASVAGKDNPLKFNEVVLNDCFLAGDETIKTDDTKFLSASAKIAEIIEVVDAELEKL